MTVVKARPGGLSRTGTRRTKRETWRCAWHQPGTRPVGGQGCGERLRGARRSPRLAPPGKGRRDAVDTAGHVRRGDHGGGHPGRRRRADADVDCPGGHHRRARRGGMHPSRPARKAAAVGRQGGRSLGACHAGPVSRRPPARRGAIPLRLGQPQGHLHPYRLAADRRALGAPDQFRGPRRGRAERGGHRRPRPGRRLRPARCARCARCARSREEEPRADRPGAGHGHRPLARGDLPRAAAAAP